jgi:hypothetical protein
MYGESAERVAMSWNDERTFPEVGYIRSDGDLVANCDTRVRNGKRRRVACDIAAESAASDATCWFTRRGRYGAHHLLPTEILTVRSQHAAIR